MKNYCLFIKRESMKKKVLFFMAVLFHFLAVAQVTDPNKMEIKEGYSARVYSKFYTPSGNSGFVSPYTQVNLTSSIADNLASATIGFKSGMSSGSIVIKQPFTDKPQKVTLLSLDGLSAGTSATISYQFTHWKPWANFDRFEAVKKDFCKRTKDTTDPRTITYQDLDAIAQDSLEKYIHWGTPLIVGVSYSIGKAEFDYIPDSSSINPQNVTKLNQNFKVTFGAIFNKAHILALIFTWQNQFDAGDPVSYSFPAGSNGARYSKDVVIGEPKLKVDERLSLEYRHTFFSHKSIPSLGLNPSISYAFLKNQLAITFPVYFLNYSEDNKVKGLQGGVAVGYITDTKKFANLKQGISANLFLSAPFDPMGLFRK
jgi:hypothetical protein